MKQRFWNKRIPTFLGLVLIGIGLAVTTFLVKQGGFISTNASPTTQPQNVRISNVTDSAYTISYETTDPVFGVLSYGDTAALGKSALDDRDQNSGKIVARKIHNITVRNLNPETKYYFSIISGKDTFLNNSLPFEVTTGAEITQSPPNQTPVSGKVILPSGQKPKEAIIYLTTNNSQVISALVKDDGTFIIPLNSLRSSDLSTYFNFDPNQKIKLLALGDGLTSNINLSISQTQPIPTITLSSDYDFSSSASISPATQNTQSFPAFTSNPVAGTDLNPKILTPTKNQRFTDQKPQFKGIAPAGQTVQIVIHTDEKIQTTVKTDTNGNWTYRPSSDLSVGNHTITLIAKDTKGAVQTITQSFVVFASGSQIAGENGSPTPTLSPSPSTRPTVAPTNSPTHTVTPTKIPGATSTPTFSPSPTSAVTVTTTATLTPTNTPTVTIVGNFTTSLSPTPALPPTGNSTIITLGLIGLVITFIGGLLFFISRGNII